MALDIIRITPATADLIDEIKLRVAETHKEHQRRQPYAFPDNEIERIRHKLIDLAFRSSSGKKLDESPTLFIARRGGEFLGYIQVSRAAGADMPPPPRVSIEDICVFPEYRQQGVGRALLNHVVAMSKDRDWDNLTAQVWVGNHDSTRLFETAGFTQEYTSYRFGPERQARDWEEPKTEGRSILVDLFWTFLPLILVLGGIAAVRMLQ